MHLNFTSECSRVLAIPIKNLLNAYSREAPSTAVNIESIECRDGVNVDSFVFLRKFLYLTNKHCKPMSKCVLLKRCLHVLQSFFLRHKKYSLWHNIRETNGKFILWSELCVLCDSSKKSNEKKKILCMQSLISKSQHVLLTENFLCSHAIHIFIHLTQLDNGIFDRENNIYQLWRPFFYYKNSIVYYAPIRP